VTVLIPVFNDWAALGSLIPALDVALAAAGRQASILVVDDGSQSEPDITTQPLVLEAIAAIDVLHLRTNLGHQRAIAIGLAHLEAHDPPEAIVVMDGDGEDRPEDVERLVHALEADGALHVVFAERRRRSEGLLFALLYWLYRVVHLVLTGERVRVGNFSVIPRYLLRRLVAVSDLWNHYAAAVFHARIPYTTVPTTRGRRYAGESRMNPVSLVTHGLAAMSVFGDRIAVRLLIVTCALTAVVVAWAGSFVLWHLVTGAALPDWTFYGVAGLALLVFLGFATSLAFVFIILAGRNSSGFLPFREFGHYVSHTTSIPIVRPNADHDLRRH
jgi:glycosyltransferase involved in cell wall biosynthesis